MRVPKIIWKARSGAWMFAEQAILSHVLVAHRARSHAVLWHPDGLVTSLSGTLANEEMRCFDF